MAFETCAQASRHKCNANPKKKCFCGNQKGHATKHICIRKGCQREWGRLRMYRRKIG